MYVNLIHLVKTNVKGEGYMYLVHYIGAIAILFLFIIMMIDIEVVEKRSNNYLPLLFLLLSGFFLTLKKILYNIGLIKMKSLTFKEELIFVDHTYGKLFNINYSPFYDKINKKGIKFDFHIKENQNFFNDNFCHKDNLLFMIMNKEDQNEEEKFNEFKFDFFFKDINTKGYYNLYLDYLRDHNIEDIYNYGQSLQEKDNNVFFHNIIDESSKYFEEYIPWIEKHNVSSYDKNLLSNISSEKRHMWRRRRFNKDKEINDNNIFLDNESDKFINDKNELKKNIFFFNSSGSGLSNYPADIYTNYLLVTPNWNSAASRITQITAIGDILYTVYHSYIYILSIILLLGMIGAIILTADNFQEIRVVNISKTKKSSIISLYSLIYIWKLNLFSKFLLNKFNFIKCSKKNNKNIFIINNYNNNNIDNVFCLKNEEIRNRYNIYKFICFNLKYLIKPINFNWRCKKNIVIPSFFHTFSSDYLHSEDVLGNLNYFIIANVIIALLLLSLNSYFSLRVKYLEKEGGFECGFTSFFQTRERFNVIFYRVSLLFLVFDLEIILAFPYTAIYQKNQNISKNNILAFLYILIIGFIYELKEGALNIVKKAHLTENNKNNKKQI